MTAGELYHHKFAPPLVRLFGSVEEALARTGIPDWPHRVREAALPRAEVIAGLRARRQAGQSLRSKAVEREEYHLYYSAMVRFGRFASALAAARIKPEIRLAEWTPEKVLDELRARRDRGESLLPRAIRQQQSSLYAAAGTYFGTYHQAVRRVLGTPPWQTQSWSEQLVIKELRRASDAGGVNRLQAGNALVRACDRYFGSFPAACVAAGLTAQRSPIGPNPRKRVKRRHSR